MRVTQTRRRYLQGIGSLGAVAIAGCTGSSSRSPEETVREYYKALNDGDIEAVRELTHEDRSDPISDKDIADWGVLAIKINKIELIEESKDKAILETVVSVETNFGVRVRSTEYELRKQNGEWRVYHTERIDVE